MEFLNTALSGIKVIAADSSFLPLVGIDIGELVITWANTLILFFIFKKLLFGRVEKVLDKRNAIEKERLLNAEKAEKEALAIKQEYEESLASAKSEADEIVKTSVSKSNKLAEEIVANAKQKADYIEKQAYAKIEMEKQKALEDLQEQISELIVYASSKILEREVGEDDNKRLIEELLVSSQKEK